MPTLQEILAAKKAKEAGIETVKPVDATPIEVQAKVVPEKTISEPVKKEEPAVAVPKPLTFAERMALKKQEEQVKSIQSKDAPVAQPSEEKPAPILALEDTTTPTVVTTKPELSETEKLEALRTGTISPALDKNPMPVPDSDYSAEVLQAASDIKHKIAMLISMSETDLENAMRDLKVALMKNPAAVALMEDSDIGQLVIALRKITGEAIAEAAKEKTPGRKPKAAKQIDLTDAEQVAKFMDEL